MKWLLRKLGLLRPKRSEMPEGFGNIDIWPIYSSTEKQFKKDIKSLLKYVTQEELNAMTDCFSLKGVGVIKVFVDEELWDSSESTKYKSIVVAAGDSRGCCDTEFINGCCGGPLGPSNLNDYFILEYLGKKDWDNGDNFMEVSDHE